MITRSAAHAQTHYPQFRLKEEADSILVRYVSGLDEAKDVPGNVVQLENGRRKTLRFPFVGDNALDDGESYTLQVYVRDLAKNVYFTRIALSKPTVESGL